MYSILCILQILRFTKGEYFDWMDSSMSVRVGAAGGWRPIQLGRNLLHLGDFPERAIGILGSFSDFSPDHHTHWGRNLIAP